MNTDAIDNSGGVDCSDHEVNIKILLDVVVEAGDLTGKQRDALLVEMTDDVAASSSRTTTSRPRRSASPRPTRRACSTCTSASCATSRRAGNLDRELEALPNDEAIGERKRDHGGLTRPELAVLLAYSKIDLYDALLDSDVPEDPYLSAELERYFPAPLPGALRRADARAPARRARSWPPRW